MIRLLLQKQSDLGLCCLSRLFQQATSVRNFKTFNCTFHCVALVWMSKRFIKIYDFGAQKHLIDEYPH